MDGYLGLSVKYKIFEVGFDSSVFFDPFHTTGVLYNFMKVTDKVCVDLFWLVLVCYCLCSAICCIIGALMTLFTSNPKYIRLALHIFVIFGTQAVMYISIIWVQLKNSNKDLNIDFLNKICCCCCCSKPKNKSKVRSKPSPTIPDSRNNTNQCSDCFYSCINCTKINNSDDIDVNQSQQECLRILCCCVGNQISLKHKSKIELRKLAQSVSQVYLTKVDSTGNLHPSHIATNSQSVANLAAKRVTNVKDFFDSNINYQNTLVFNQFKMFETHLLSEMSSENVLFFIIIIQLKQFLIDFNFINATNKHYLNNFPFTMPSKYNGNSSKPRRLTNRIRSKSKSKSKSKRKQKQRSNNNNNNNSNNNSNDPNSNHTKQNSLKFSKNGKRTLKKQNSSNNDLYSSDGASSDDNNIAMGIGISNLRQTSIDISQTETATHTNTMTFTNTATGGINNSGFTQSHATAYTQNMRKLLENAEMLFVENGERRTNLNNDGNCSNNDNDNDNGDNNNNYHIFLPFFRELFEQFIENGKAPLELNISFDLRNDVTRHLKYVFKNNDLMNEEYFFDTIWNDLVSVAMVCLDLMEFSFIRYVARIERLNDTTY